MKTEISTLSRALILNGQVSLAVADTTALVREAATRHHLSAGSLAVLGKTLTAAAYLCGWLKGEKSSLTVSVASDGDFGRISVLGDGTLRVRGYVGNAFVEAGRLGNGTLSVVRDDGERLPFAGTVPLVSEEMEDNFSAYFKESEQLLTGVALSVVSGDGVKNAGGVFLQALPHANAEARALVESGAARFKKFLDCGQTEKIFQEFGVEKTDTREVKFACRCSRERVGALLLSMGKAEAFALLKQEGQISVHCEYCNTDYIFKRENVKELFQKHGR